MRQYQAEVRVTPREGLPHRQGKAVEHTLHQLEASDAEKARVGKLVHLRLHDADDDDALRRADDMCRKLRARVMGTVADFAVARGPVLDICNGFQIPCEAGLLAGAGFRGYP